MTIRITDSNAIFVLQDEIHRSEEARYDHRLHAVLMVAQGMTCPTVSEILGDADRTIRYWVERYNQEGLPGLVEIDKPGRPKRLSDKQLYIIGKVLRQDPLEVGMTSGIWDGKTLSAYIKSEFRIALSVRQCQRIFRFLGFRLRKPRPMMAYSDADKQHEFKKK